MTPPNMFVRRNLERLDRETVARFEGTPTGWIVDANGRRGALDYRIKPLFMPRPFVGSALTVWTVPNDNLVPYLAISFAKPGDVMVIATEETTGNSVIGDVLIGMARNAGVVAIVTDGMVRDIDGIEQVGIPICARGLSANSPGKNGPGRIGWPVSLGGLSIANGDLVAGDRNGVIAVSRAAVPGVLQEIEKVKKKEKDMDAAVTAGATQPGWMAEYLAKNPVAVLD